jgi:hypothetical protein
MLEPVSIYILGFLPDTHQLFLKLEFFLPKREIKNQKLKIKWFWRVSIARSEKEKWEEISDFLYLVLSV